MDITFNRDGVKSGEMTLKWSAVKSNLDANAITDI